MDATVTARREGAARPSGRNAALDGLRGYAAAAVVFYHCILGPSPHLIPEVLNPPISAQHTLYGVALKLALTLLSGEVAVEVFFVISGIVLFRSLALIHDGNAPRTAWVFTLRRFLRIWPVMAFCLVAKVGLLWALNAAFPFPMPTPGLDALWRNLLLVAYPVNGATWTLHAELLMVGPLLVLFFAWQRPAALALLGTAALVAAIFWHHRLLGLDMILTISLPFFVAGAAIERGVFDRLFRSRFGGPAALLGAAGMIAAILLMPGGSSRRLGLQVVCALLVVGWVYTARGGAVIRFLEAPVSRFLGRVSYSLYLWNVLVFEIMLALLDGRMERAHPLETGLAVGLAAILVTLPIAHLSERWLEQPCIALGRALTRRRRIPSPVPAVPLLAQADGD